MNQTYKHPYTRPEPLKSKRKETSQEDNLTGRQLQRKISGARNRPRMMISGARNLQSHNEVFWAQKSSFLDDFWGQKSSHIEDFWAQNICRIIMTIYGARNHHSNIFDQKLHYDQENLYLTHLGILYSEIV